MKKVIVFQVIVLACILFGSIKSFGQTFLEYTVDGVEYKVDEEKMTSFCSYNTDLEDKVLCKSATADVSGIYGILHLAQLHIYVDTNYVWKKDTFNLVDDIAYYEQKHIAHLEITKHPSEDKYEWYRSEKGTKGHIIITKVDGNFIEGTFEGILKAQYPLTANPPIKVTNGRFRISVKMLRTDWGE